MNLKVIKSHQCCLERSHAVFIELNSEFSSRPSPSSSRQIVRSNRRKNLQKQNNEDFFLKLLHFANNNFPAPTCTEQILDQPIFLSPHTKLNFSSDNPYFYCISPINVSYNFTIIRNLCRFLQPGLISSTKFDQKPTANYKKTYKLIMDLISNDWKHLNITETLRGRKFGQCSSCLKMQIDWQ